MTISKIFPWLRSVSTCSRESMDIVKNFLDYGDVLQDTVTVHKIIVETSRRYGRS